MQVEALKRQHHEGGSVSETGDHHVSSRIRDTMTSHMGMDGEINRSMRSDLAGMASQGSAARVLSSRSSWLVLSSDKEHGKISYKRVVAVFALVVVVVVVM